MPGDWTPSEVEATVADYFDMLERELRGIRYNKAEHRRRLAGVLNQRSAGAIERKHQNISAVLIALGFVYIPGYKPLHNYQQLLFDAVSDRLGASHGLAALVESQVVEPAIVPSIDEILSVLVEAPSPDTGGRRKGAGYVRERRSVRAGVDYIATEARNRSLGAAGEEFVVRFEVARLVHMGKDHLAYRVEHVSETRGDGLGYDVLSFEVSGEERLIEVKTTAYGPSTPFFVTRNEVAVSREMSERYHLYRPFNFRREPRLFTKRGSLEASFHLEASQFIASVG